MGELDEVGKRRTTHIRIFQNACVCALGLWSGYLLNDGKHWSKVRHFSTRVTFGVVGSCDFFRRLFQAWSTMQSMCYKCLAMRSNWNELHQELGVKEKKIHWWVATIKGIDYIRRNYSLARFISFIWLTSIVLDYVVLSKLWKRFVLLYGCFSMWIAVLEITFSVKIVAAELLGCKPPKKVFNYHISFHGGVLPIHACPN